MQSGGLVFLTVNDNGLKNPRSALLIEALKRLDGVTASVIGSMTEYRPPTDDAMVIPLHDVESGVNRWSPRTTDKAPDWVRTLSTTRSCVAVGSLGRRSRFGHRGAAFPEVVAGTARQIATMFRQDWNGSGQEYPWGTGKKRKSRHKQGRLFSYRPWARWSSYLSR